MTNICERWSKNHTNALQYALFNGDGFESWENVWGTWNGELRDALRFTVSWSARLSHGGVRVRRDDGA